MKQIMNVFRDTAVLVVAVGLVLAVGLAVAGCAGNTSNAPSAPSPPAVSSAPPTRSVPSPVSWAGSMCQALGPAFSQLGKPPELDPGNMTGTGLAFIGYLNGSANAVQQALDQLSSLGAPPVENGQHILDQMRMQLTQLRDNLRAAVPQLMAAKGNDAALLGLLGQTMGATGNVIGLLGTLAQSPQLRAAIDQAPECQTLPGLESTTQPTS